MLPPPCSFVKRKKKKQIKEEENTGWLLMANWNLQLHPQKYQWFRIDQITEYDSFEYQAKSWDKPYRIIIITTVSKDNVHFRFVVTDLYNIHPKILYEKLYCHRGNQELYIKELKGDLRSDLTPCKKYTANFFRVLLASLVYNIIILLRKEGLKGTQFANSTAAKIKLKLFKMAVKVISCKDRIILHLPESYPYKNEMTLLLERLFQTHKFINTSLP